MGESDDGQSHDRTRTRTTIQKRPVYGRHTAYTAACARAKAKAVGRKTTVANDPVLFVADGRW